MIQQNFNTPDGHAVSGKAPPQLATPHPDATRLASGYAPSISDAQLQDAILDRLAPVKGPDTKGNYTSFCPFHDDQKTANLSYHPQKGFICRACGEKGGNKKLGIQTKVGFATGRAARINANDATVLLRQRGLTPQTIGHYGIVYDERRQAWRYPIMCNGQPEATRFKHVDSSHKPKFWWDKNNPRRFFVYGLDDISQNTTEVFLVAGEPDVWTCYQENIPALSFLGGESTVKRSYFETIQQHLPWVRTLRVVYDDDAAGRKGAAAAVRVGRETGFEINAYNIAAHNTTGRKGFEVTDLQKAVNHA